MKKKSEKVLKTQPEVDRAVRALKAAQTKREKRYANTRIVYVYYNPDTGKCTDNMLVLSADTVDAHSEYFRRALTDMFKDVDVERRKAVSKIRVRRIATFNVETYEFHPIRKPIDLFDFGSLFKKASKK